MPSVRNVLIVGAGISGLSLAIGLARAGIRVRIVEREPEVRVAGVGIILQGTTLRAFQLLGLLDEVLRAGFGYDRSRTLDGAGNEVSDRPFPKVLGPDYPAAAGIPRRVLADLLTMHAVRHGVQVRYDATVCAVDDRSDAIGVRFSDGQSEEFDLIVGCDGLHSTVRQLVFGERVQPAYTGQGVWRFMCARDPRVTTSSNLRFGRYPLGFIPLSRESMYLFLLENDPVAAPKDPARLHEILRDRLSGYGPFIDAIRDQVVTPAQVNFRSLQTLMLPTPWYRGRAIVIGDAAHTMTPHLASGAAMAIEDALVLAEVLRDGEALEPALARFMVRRFERANFTLEMSVQVGAWQIAGVPIDYDGHSSRLREYLSLPP